LGKRRKKTKLTTYGIKTNYPYFLETSGVKM
jgi:hypothetical protein